MHIQKNDNVESFVSLLVDLPVIIPHSIPADTSGFLRLTNCQIGSDDGNVPIGDATINGVDVSTFLFGFHGMAVGPFGTDAMARDTAE